MAGQPIRTLLGIIVCAALGAAEPGSGLLGEYFANKYLDGAPAFSTVEAIDHDWGGSSPGGLPSVFSVRWSGEIAVPASGVWTFSALADDGIAVLIDGEAVAIDWSDHPPREVSGSIELAAGVRHAIEVLYYQRGGEDVARLDWAGPGVSRQRVPASALFATATSARRLIIPRSSAVSPLQIENLRPPGSEVAVHGRGRVDVTEVGADRFIADVPLTADRATKIMVTTAIAKESERVVWRSTGFDGPPIVLRRGDSLLMLAPARGTIGVTAGSGWSTAPFPVVARRSYPVVFGDAGHATVRLAAPDGTLLASREVVVVGVDASRGLAGELGYGRTWRFAVEPADAAVGVGSSDADHAWCWLQDDDGSGPRAGVVPLRADGGALVLRLGDHGPVLAAKPIEGFAVDLDAALAAAFDPDGISRTHLDLIPLRPRVLATFEMFASRSTFLGGARWFSVATDGSPTSLGEEGFVVFDDAPIGRLRYTMESPADEIMFCFALLFFQDGERIGFQH